jgi:hypothetical protein
VDDRDQEERRPLLVNYSTVILDFQTNTQNSGKFKVFFKFHHGELLFVSVLLPFLATPSD